MKASKTDPVDPRIAEVVAPRDRQEADALHETELHSWPEKITDEELEASVFTIPGDK